jgi:hypothetical protein
MSKFLSDKFLIQNGPKQENALSTELFNVSLVYAIRKVQENQVGLNGSDDDVNLLGGNIDIESHLLKARTVKPPATAVVREWLQARLLIGNRIVTCNSGITGNRCSLWSM